MTATDANADVRHKESEFYRLFRRVFIAQLNGNYDIGDKFRQIVSEPRTEAEFDECMEKALKEMGST